jgi:hypothetical protein
MRVSASWSTWSPSRIAPSLVRATYGARATMQDAMTRIRAIRLPDQAPCRWQGPVVDHETYPRVRPDRADPRHCVLHRRPCPVRRPDATGTVLGLVVANIFRCGSAGAHLRGRGGLAHFVSGVPRRCGPTHPVPLCHRLPAGAGRWLVGHQGGSRAIGSGWMSPCRATVTSSQFVRQP